MKDTNLEVELLTNGSKKHNSWKKGVSSMPNPYNPGTMGLPTIWSAYNGDFARLELHTRKASVTQRKPGMRVSDRMTLAT
jgi:hypothetical protein